MAEGLACGELVEGVESACGEPFGPELTAEGLVESGGVVASSGMGVL